MHKNPPGAAPGENIIGADFVVDASGRSSHMPEWLENLGLPRPQESTLVWPMPLPSTRSHTTFAHPEMEQPSLSKLPLPHEASRPSSSNGIDYW
jgi:hypothetical protein